MDLRRYRRLDTQLDVTIYSRESTMSATIENISITGASLRCFSNVLHPGDMIDISVSGVSQRSTIVWAGTLHVGVDFLKPLVRGPLYDLLAQHPYLLERNNLRGPSLERLPSQKTI